MALVLMDAKAELIEINDIKSYLFQQHTGSFLPALSENKDLWNVIIGEKGISEPTSSLFVDVVITGKANSFFKNQKVKLIVRDIDSRRVLYNFTATEGSFGANGVGHVGFWLPSVGCESLTIKAIILKNSKTINLPFKCGE